MPTLKNAMNINIKFPWTQFLIGGTLFAIIKYASTNINDIRIAGTIAAAPIGFAAMLMVPENKQIGYVSSYIIAVIILTAIYILMLGLLKVKTNIYLSIVICFIVWIVVNYIKITYTKF